MKIGATVYPFVFRKLINGDSNILGHIGFKEQTVQVRKGMGADITRLTIVHETLHGMMFAIGHDDNDEKVVNRLAHVMLEWVRDNPELLEYLRG